MVEHDTPPPKPAKLPTTAARQGVTVGRMRYILAISTVLAVLAMAVAYALS